MATNRMKTNSDRRPPSRELLPFVSRRGFLAGSVADGHPIGNHTYDHVRITATKLEDVQYRFGRSPWLISGKTPLEAIAEIRDIHRRRTVRPRRLVTVATHVRIKDHHE